MRPPRRRVALAGVATGAIALAGGRNLAGRVFRRFDWAGEPDERLVATTDDGWRVGIAHYYPRGRVKQAAVVTGHGFAGSALIYDLAPEVSMARYLADAGYHVFCVDLRGRRSSWPPNEDQRLCSWSFDDFIYYDIPAAVGLAIDGSGLEAVYWLGTEMSGQALYASLVEGRAPGLRGGVTFGAPVLTPPSARVPGVTSMPKGRRHGRVPFAKTARWAGPVLAYLHSHELDSSFVMANCDPLPVARYFWNGVPDESSVLGDQFRHWVERSVMDSLDGRTRWSDRLDEIEAPLLLVSGARDLQRPTESVEETAGMLVNAKVRFVRCGKADGFSTDYGHDDLFAGRSAPREVFPLVREWLDEQVGE